jgi:hypothetical protein
MAALACADAPTPPAQVDAGVASRAMQAASGDASARVAPATITAAAACSNIVPCPVSLYVGQTEAVTAIVQCSQVGWTWNPSSNPSVATVTPKSNEPQTGIIKAVGVGTATISGSCLGGSGNVTVNVLSDPVPSRVDVTPVDIVLPHTTTRQYAAAAYDAQGRLLPNRPVSAWSSSNTAVATISSSGLVTTKTAGSTTISATILGRTGSTSLRVAIRVSISGPTSITSSTTSTYTWRATATGSSSGTYTYSWTCITSTNLSCGTGTASSFTRLVNGTTQPSFTLHLRANSPGVTGATASYYVATNGSGPK